ncbi:MAG TPA: histidine kinase [Candidatus Polarisedimenticolia bacterium]|nr:histidine kinase [Candidatus Polarisedimenticolia bacterium]
MTRRRWVRWLLPVGLWTALVLFSASRLQLGALSTENPAPWGRSLRLAAADWYSWALLAPAAAWMVRRFPLRRGRWAAPAAAHLGGAVLLTVVKMILEHNVNQAIVFNPMRRLSVLYFHPNFLTCLAILGVLFALEASRRSREHELRASRLEAGLAEARLRALRDQLHPHFLFNTLQAISTLIHRDPAAADAMVLRLSDLLRLTLDLGEKQDVPLRAEIDLVDRYLEILGIRFGHRLQVRRRLDPEALDALLPSMLLQPLVENAVRHGIAPRPEGGRLEIAAAVRDGRLRVTVRDDGPGPGGNGGRGLGLANTRSRLRELYGDDHLFELRAARGGGSEALVEVPLRRGTEEGGARARSDR